jgi:hypothetical protein
MAGQKRRLTQISQIIGVAFFAPKNRLLLALRESQETLFSLLFLACHVSIATRSGAHLAVTIDAFPPSFSHTCRLAPGSVCAPSTLPEPDGGHKADALFKQAPRYIDGPAASSPAA